MQDDAGTRGYYTKESVKSITEDVAVQGSSDTEAAV